MSVFDQALVDHRAGRLDAAAAGYRKVLDRDPDHADACHLLGLTLHQRGENGLAEAIIHRAIQLNGRIANYHNSLGLTLYGQGKRDAALEVWHRAAELDPADSDIRNNLGMVLTDLGRYDDAATALQEALRARPENFAAMNNLGRVKVWLADYGAAVDLLRQACEGDPHNSTYWNSLGVALREQGDQEQALEAFAKALHLAPDLVDAHVNRAQVLLLLGKYEEGWREHEWRLRHPRHAARNRDTYWEGQDIAGKTVLLWSEQGYGDAIQFVRYAREVAGCGARVVVECRPALQRLFRSMESVAETVSPDAEPDFDFHAPLMSLPLLLDCPPDPAPYLAASPRELQDGATGRRVGLVWAGNPDHANDRNRSHRLEQFGAVAVPGNTYYALQTGPAAGEEAPAAMPVTRLGEGFGDFADTAAALAAMDLVICVDTAVAHLAGALGRPVWLILPANPDWRWGLSGDTTPWYGTMKLFRQSTGEPRDAVFARIADALSRL